MNSGPATLWRERKGISDIALRVKTEVGLYVCAPHAVATEAQFGE